MKKLIVILCLLSMFMSCERGGTTISLTGNESALPPELKGLKVYNVNTSALGQVRVAVLNGQVNSTTYSVGKTTETVVNIYLPNGTPRTINCKEIISETDDIIVIRKK